jgi:hypothetical protein
LTKRIATKHKEFWPSSNKELGIIFIQGTRSPEFNLSDLAHVQYLGNGTSWMKTMVHGNTSNQHNDAVPPNKNIVIH